MPKLEIFKYSPKKVRCLHCKKYFRPKTRFNIYCPEKECKKALVRVYNRKLYQSCKNQSK